MLDIIKNSVFKKEEIEKINSFDNYINKKMLSRISKDIFKDGNYADIGEINNQILQDIISNPINHPKIKTWKDYFSKNSKSWYTNQIGKILIPEDTSWVKFRSLNDKNEQNSALKICLLKLAIEDGIKRNIVDKAKRVKFYYGSKFDGINNNAISGLKDYLSAKIYTINMKTHALGTNNAPNNYFIRGIGNTAGIGLFKQKAVDEFITCMQLLKPFANIWKTDLYEQKSFNFDNKNENIILMNNTFSRAILECRYDPKYDKKFVKVKKLYNKNKCPNYQIATDGYSIINGSEGSNIANIKSIIIFSEDERNKKDMISVWEYITHIYFQWAEFKPNRKADRLKCKQAYADFVLMISDIVNNLDDVKFTNAHQYREFWANLEPLKNPTIKKLNINVLKTLTAMENDNQFTHDLGLSAKALWSNKFRLANNQHVKSLNSFISSINKNSSIKIGMTRNRYNWLHRIDSLYEREYYLFKAKMYKEFYFWGDSINHSNVSRDYLMYYLMKESNSKDYGRFKLYRNEDYKIFLPFSNFEAIYMTKTQLDYLRIGFGKKYNYIHFFKESPFELSERKTNKKYLSYSRIKPSIFHLILKNLQKKGIKFSFEDLFIQKKTKTCLKKRFLGISIKIEEKSLMFRSYLELKDYSNLISHYCKVYDDEDGKAKIILDPRFEKIFLSEQNMTNKSDNYIKIVLDDISEHRFEFYRGKKKNFESKAKNKESIKDLNINDYETANLVHCWVHDLKFKGIYKSKSIYNYSINSEDKLRDYVSNLNLPQKKDGSFVKRPSEAQYLPSKSIEKNNQIIQLIKAIDGIPILNDGFDGDSIYEISMIHHDLLIWNSIGKSTEYVIEKGGTISNAFSKAKPLSFIVPNGNFNSNEKNLECISYKQYYNKEFEEMDMKTAIFTFQDQQYWRGVKIYALKKIWDDLDPNDEKIFEIFNHILWKFNILELYQSKSIFEGIKNNRLTKVNRILKSYYDCKDFSLEYLFMEYLKEKYNLDHSNASKRWSKFQSKVLSNFEPDNEKMFCENYALFHDLQFVENEHEFINILNKYNKKYLNLSWKIPHKKGTQPKYIALILNENSPYFGYPIKYLSNGKVGIRGRGYYRIMIKNSKDILYQDKKKIKIGANLKISPFKFHIFKKTYFYKFKIFQKYKLGIIKDLKTALEEIFCNHEIEFLIKNWDSNELVFNN